MIHLTLDGNYFSKKLEGEFGLIPVNFVVCFCIVVCIQGEFLDVIFTTDTLLQPNLINYGQ